VRTKSIGRYIGVLAALCASALVLGTGCARNVPVHAVVFEEGRDYVKLEKLVDRNKQVVARDYAHPYKFTEEQLRAILDSYEYSEYAFFSWSKPKRVFFEEEIDMLAPSLVKAFAVATKDDTVVFSSTARKRDLLLPTWRQTTGMFFVEVEQLHFVLGNLNVEISDESSELYTEDPRSRWGLKTFKLVRGLNQSEPRVDKKDRYLKKPHDNWIVTDLPAFLARIGGGEEPAAGPEIPSSEVAGEDAQPKPEAPSAPEKSIKDRLEELKALYEAGLITEQEYEQKRAALLQEL